MLLSIDIDLRLPFNTLKYCNHIQLAYVDRSKGFIFNVQRLILVDQGNVDILPYRHVSGSTLAFYMYVYGIHNNRIIIDFLVQELNMYYGYYDRLNVTSE